MKQQPSGKEIEKCRTECPSRIAWCVGSGSTQEHYGLAEREHSGGKGWLIAGLAVAGLALWRGTTSALTCGAI